LFHQFEKTSRPRVWDKIGKSKKYGGFYSGFLCNRKQQSFDDSMIDSLVFNESYEGGFMSHK